MDKEFNGMKWFKSKAKRVYVAALILITLAITMGSAQATFTGGGTTVQGKIIPPSSYQVYTGQTYSLTVGVQYSIAAAVPGTRTVAAQYYFWIESPPYTSSGTLLQGSGTVAFSLTLRAPSTPGTYQLTLNLYAQARGAQRTLLDTSSVGYRVIRPIVTDWDVEKVWMTPAAPGEGDQVTFHATFALQSTTSTEALTVGVACLLDNALYYTGSLTFAPQPSKQDVSVPKTWTATKGTHVLECVIDPNRQHNDPTPYPNYNLKVIKFNVEAAYAFIYALSAGPPEINEGQEFTVVITVAYRFPGNTPGNLKVGHRSNQTSPPASDETLDSVKLTGAGTKDYTFHARAPFTPATLGSTATWTLWGEGYVMFDRGAGWQKTQPGWSKYYNITIKRPSYYAVFDAVTAQYTGATNAPGHITITLQVRYLLPIQTGLKIIVYRLNDTSSQWQQPVGATGMPMVWQDEFALTQKESVEKTATYTYAYTVPASAITSNTMSFSATIQYLAYGTWNFGDQRSASASVPYNPPPKSIADYFTAAVRRILDWFRTLFGGLSRIPAF